MKRILDRVRIDRLPESDPIPVQARSTTLELKVPTRSCQPYRQLARLESGKPVHPKKEVNSHLPLASTKPGSVPV